MDTRTQPFALGTLLLCATLLTGSLLPAIHASPVSPSRFPGAALSPATFGEWPLRFEPNLGQSDAAVRFLARGPGYQLALLPAEVAVAFWPAAASRRPAIGGAAASTASERRRTVLRLEFANADPTADLLGLDRLSGVVNYYTGADPSRWRKSIPTYARVQYRGIYPGIDAVFYGNGQQIEYDFVVAPGADPGVIGLQVAGADRLLIEPGGDLILDAAGSQFRLRKPLIYQEMDGRRQAIEGGYLLRNGNEFGFSVAAYDPRRPLGIDPILDYSSYFGGDGADYGYAVATDSAGNVYFTGATNSANFPTVNAAQPVFGGGGVDCPSDLPTRVCYDAFVTKINAAGNAILYSTYLGNPGDDEGRAIAVDSTGNAYITGQISLPGEPPLQDLYIYKYTLIAKLGTTGNLIYGASYGSGSGSIGLGIAVDSAGQAYVTGEVSSAVPTTPDAIQPDKLEAIDAFVAVVNAAGDSLLYSTYLGCSGAYCEVCESSGRGIAVDAAGKIYVTGQAAPSFPVTANAFQTEFHGLWQAFVAQIDPTIAGAGGLIYSSLLGGNTSDFGHGIALDPTGKVYVTGAAKSDDFPVTPGAFDGACGTDGLCNPTTVCSPGQPPVCSTKPQEDAFVAKFDLSKSGAQSLVFSTYVGGSGRDEGSAIDVAPNGEAYVSGLTVSPDFPTVNPLQPNYGGNLDAVVFGLNASGSQLTYSTFMGGGGDDAAYGIATDSVGNTYVAGMTGSGGFPILNPLRPRSGSWEAFISKFGAQTTNTFRTHLPLAIKGGG
jgi:hypothetical protein